MKPWLVWDSGNGNIEEYATEKEALEFAAESLDTYREEARDEGEWDDGVESIGVYKLAHNSDITDSGKGETADWVEYGIVKAPHGELTAREKWLMEQAYEYGACHRDIYFVNWIEQSAADAVTVGMVLAKEAP